MKKQQWIKYTFFFSTIIVTIVFLIMLWSDTYSNTHYDRTKFYSEPNKNVLKTHYIINNPTKYDSFIFGSSRVENINPLKIKTNKYYNMTYSEGIPQEHLLNIQLFIRKGVKIKNLLIGLDEFSYQVAFEKHQHQGLTKSYYEATNTNIITYYKELYLRFPLGEDRRYIKKKLSNSPNYYNLNVATQELKYKNELEHFKIVNYETQEHLNNPKFNEPTYYNGNVLEKTLKSIQQLKNICTKRNISCIFFINPIHHKTYEYTNKILLNSFKSKLAHITSYYDFSKQTPLNYNNRFWKDTSHYTLEVGDMILSKIFDNNSSIKEFGNYVKKVDFKE